MCDGFPILMKLLIGSIERSSRTGQRLIEQHQQLQELVGPPVGSTTVVSESAALKRNTTDPMAGIRQAEEFIGRKQRRLNKVRELIDQATSLFATQAQRDRVTANGKRELARIARDKKKLMNEEKMLQSVIDTITQAKEGRESLVSTAEVTNVMRGLLIRPGDVEKLASETEKTVDDSSALRKQMTELQEKLSKQFETSESVTDEVLLEEELAALDESTVHEIVSPVPSAPRDEPIAVGGRGNGGQPPPSGGVPMPQLKTVEANRRTASKVSMV